MRIYEIAKKFKLTSKDLLAVLKKEGIEAASHMSVLSDQDVKKVEALLSGKKKTATSEKKSASTKNVDSGRAVKASPQAKATAARAKQKSVSTNQNKSSSDKKSSTISTKEQPAGNSVHTKTVSTSGAKASTPSKTFHSPSSSSRAKPGTPGRSSSVGRGGGQGKRSGKRASYKRSRRPEPVVPVIITEVEVKEPMALFQAAEMMGKPSSELALALLRKGTIANRNHILPVDTIKELAELFEIAVLTPEKKVVNNDEAELARLEALEKSGTKRWPIVVVMGHVDHGKTTLLDHIRSMNVAAREKGGITQHLSAYDVECKQGKVVFLDTPGHEAFTYLRKRGASVTDIAILVVAADDGVMPQTVEAIKHARESGVQIIVAINKMDKPGADIEKIKAQLAKHDLVAEDWGGSTVVVPISALTGDGIDSLLEMIILQGELLELKSLKDAPGKAFVLESHVEKGFGSVAAAISTEGTISVGDFFVCGEGSGKIRLLVDSHGKRVKSVGPAIPVRIVGFDGAVEMGDWLKVVPQAEYLKARSGKSTLKSQSSSVQQQDMSSLQGIDSDGKRYINIILKTDTRGSREAIIGSISKLLKEKREIGCPITVVNSGIGGISEGDIELAANTDSFVVSFNVKIERNAQGLAKKKTVQVKEYQIIYKLIEDLEALLETKRVKKTSWKKVGDAIVRKVFDIKGLGIIAGCYLREGTCTRKHKAVCVRNGKKIGESSISSLQRERKSVKEVHAGYEFGFIADSFHDWQIDDTVEFLIEETED